MGANYRILIGIIFGLVIGIGVGVLLGSMMWNEERASRSVTNSQSAPEKELPRAADQVEVNGGVGITYESFGPVEGETVLLIGGTGMQLTAWPPDLIEKLAAQGYRVVIFDNRDVGLSARFAMSGWPNFETIDPAVKAGKAAPLAYTMDDMAADAVGLLAVLGIEKAHLVGVSMGGTIAQLMAADHPERTLSLTTIMSESGNPELPMVADLEALMKVPPLTSPFSRKDYIECQIRLSQLMLSPGYPLDEEILRKFIVREVERAYSPAGEARQSAAIMAAHFTDRTAKLRSIAVPAMIIHGAEDPLIPVASASDLAAKIPNSELRIIPGMGHDLPAALIPDFVEAIKLNASRVKGGP